jgi:hypothetical protein
MAKKPRVLTDTFITGLKPAPKGQRESFADALVPGLKIRVTDRGAKSFILWRRFPPSKNPAARSLGAVGALTLTEARDKARRWLELIAQGKDPRTVERNEREAEQGRNGVTFGDVFEKYLASHVKGEAQGGGYRTGDAQGPSVALERQATARDHPPRHHTDG